MSQHDIELTVNGDAVSAKVESRHTLADFLRGELGRTGVHVGCEHGVCGACTVIVDGDPVRSCLMFAVQADGAAVETVEGLASEDGELHVVQQAMRDEFGLQCGFCTPGVLMTMAAMTANGARPSQDDMLDAVSGHLCRCTGYQGIKRAALRLSEVEGMTRS